MVQVAPGAVIVGNVPPVVVSETAAASSVGAIVESICAGLSGEKSPPRRLKNPKKPAPIVSIKDDI